MFDMTFRKEDPEWQCDLYRVGLHSLCMQIN